MSFQASCPACAAPVQFDVANSLVTVCQSCSSLVGRGDGKLEDFGKVADLVQTDSPLQIGIRGKYKGVGFSITGRTQLQHADGGIWDEWYLAFKDGQRWGWLSDSQGTLHLTVERKTPADHHYPSIEELDTESEVLLPQIGTMKVSEIGEASYVAAEGEIPFTFRPNESFFYADLSGGGRKFATLDYADDPPTLYAGNEVTYEKLGIADTVRDREKELRSVSGVQVKCPSCAAPLELSVPDQARRVACQFCGALNEVDKGNLVFIEKASKLKVKPVIPLGTVGKLTGEMFGEKWESPLEYKVIGFMQRKTVYENVPYFWQEYLLYRPRCPFVWLIHSEGHWSLGQAVPAGEIASSFKTARYEGSEYRLFERSKPKVTYVLGEFYWSVSVGETVNAADYIRPPKMVSKEVSASKDGQKKKKEVNYTVSKYLTVEQVETAFGVSNIEVPTSIGAIQPFPFKGIYRVAAALLAVAVLFGLLAAMSSSGEQVFKQSYPIKKVFGDTVIPPQPLEIKGGKNIWVSCKGGQWAYVNGTLFNESTGQTCTFGVENGSDVYLSAIPAGRYKLTMQYEGRTIGGSFSIDIKQGVLHWKYFIWTLMALLIIPILLAVYHFSFEGRRWADSDYNPYSSE